MAASTNPYVAGLPVGGTDGFVGRTSELETLSTVLSTGQTQAVLLTGAPGIGRSSLLRQLEHTLDAHGEVHSVRVCLQDRIWDPLDDVISHLADAVGRALRITEPELGHWAENRFAERWLPLVLERIHEDDRIVFLFDEFPVVFDPRSRQAAGALLPWFAGLLEQFPGRFRAVFTTDLRLQNQEAIVRRYFPDLYRLELGPLDAKATRDLIQRAHGHCSFQWSTGALERVEALCGGHPFFLQLTCSLVWNRHHSSASHSDVYAIDVNALIESTIDSGTPVFEALWSGLPSECRVLAAALAWQHNTAVHTDRTVALLEECGVPMVTTTLEEDAPAELRRQGLLHPRTDALMFGVPLFRLWIRAHCPLEVAFTALDQVVPEADRLFQVAERKWQTASNEATRREAVEQLEEVLRLNPNHTTATEMLGMEHERRGEPITALAYLERLFEIQPSRARPKLVRILLQLADQESSSARKTRRYDRILQIAPGQPQATRARAQLQPVWRRTRTPSSAPAPLPSPTPATDATAPLDNTISPTVASPLRPRAPSPPPKVGSEQSSFSPTEADPSDDSELALLYDAARVALDVGDRETARRHLGRVAAEQPTFRETARYLYLAVHNVDPAATVHAPGANPKRTIRALTAGILVLAASLLVSITTRPQPPPTADVQALSSAIPTGPAPSPPVPVVSSTESVAAATHPEAAPATVVADLSLDTPAPSETVHGTDTHLDTEPPPTPEREPSPEPPTPEREPSPEPRKASSSEALIQRGWSALEAGALTEAESLFDAAVSRSPHNPDAHYSLAYAAEKLGSLDMAFIHYCSALRYAARGSVVQRDVSGRLLQLEMTCN